MFVQLVFASTPDGGFGYQGGLPWGNPIEGDMEVFKDVTEDTALLMGRATFESLSRKLRNLRHFVLTSEQDIYKLRTQDGSIPDGIISNPGGIEPVGVLKGLEEVLGSDARISVIGGTKMIEDFASLADEVVHTLVMADVSLDTWVDLTKVFKIFRDFTRIKEGLEGQDLFYEIRRYK